MFPPIPECIAMSQNSWELQVGYFYDAWPNSRESAIMIVFSIVKINSDLHSLLKTSRLLVHQVPPKWGRPSAVEYTRRWRPSLWCTTWRRCTSPTAWRTRRRPNSTMKTPAGFIKPRVQTRYHTHAHNLNDVIMTNLRHVHRFESQRPDRSRSLWQMCGKRFSRLITSGH